MFDLRRVVSILRSSWRFFLRREEIDQELDAEVRSHLALVTDEKIAGGMEPEEARRAARIELGGVEQVKDKVRSGRAAVCLDVFLQDLRFGIRMLRKNPGFTIVAVVTLALGIGANTAIFSMVNWVVVQKPRVSHPEQVVTLATQGIGGRYGDVGFSYPNFQDIRDQAASVFSEVAATREFGMDGLRVGNSVQPIWTNYVTTNFFHVLGVEPALGSLIRPDAERLADDAPVLVLGYAFWQAHFAGDPSVVGKVASINGHPVTIIGVAPKGFHGISPLLDAQGYLPLGMAIVTSDLKKDFLADRKSLDLTILARLRAGVTAGSSAPALSVIARRLSARYPSVDKWSSLSAYPLSTLSPVDDPSGPQTMLLMSALFLLLTGLVLLLACLNVANLLLARASVRRHEMGIRTAVGAARSRLVRQLLTESLLLAFLGCAAGIAVGLMSSRWISSVNLKTAVPIVLDFHFDWRVFSYAFITALIAGALVGIVPAIRTTRGNLTDLLHESGRTTTAARQRTRAALVIAQVAGSLMLLIVSGLFMRSLQKVQHSDLGFDPIGVCDFTIDAHEAGYTEAQGQDLMRSLLQRVRALPGVETAGWAAAVPMGYYSFGRDLNIPGYQPPTRQETPRAGYNAVSSAYFETMRIPIVRGRTFLDSDGQASQRVAIINEAMADKFWRGENPIGRRFTTIEDPKHPIEIVGEVRNSRNHRPYGSYDPYMYVPLAQAYQMPVTLHVRTALPMATVNGEIVRTVHSLAPAMPVFDVQTMSEALDTLNGRLLFKIGAGLTATLGILGLTLAVIGVFGVVSYGASQRTHEIGIRMALGANPAQILKMIFGQGFFMVACGALLGALAAAGIGHLVGDFLVGVSPLDAATYSIATLLLAAVALAACYIPARRAMRVDPMVALRHE